MWKSAFSASGRYYFPLSVRYVDAAATADGHMLTITDAQGAVLASLALKSVRTCSRLGTMRRRLDFPDGSGFDTPDNDAIDAMLPRTGWLHRLENSWRTALASVLVTALAAAAFLLYGVPWTAAFLAQRTPPDIARFASQQTLSTLDRLALEPSKLTAARQRHYQNLLTQLARQAPRGEAGYRLVFRSAPGIGPNAFALPDGTIVATDEMIGLTRKDAEIQGVLGHEMSHVDRLHGLQSIYQASLVPAAIAFITGDISQVGQIATILPGILLQSAYSRGFEQQADDDGVLLMRKLGKSPAAMADLLERMDKATCSKGNCSGGWLSSHPDTVARAARLRRN
jgi:Zn-dependent protease with chaperone function